MLSWAKPQIKYFFWKKNYFFQVNALSNIIDRSKPQHIKLFQQVLIINRFQSFFSASFTQCIATFRKAWIDFPDCFFALIFSIYWNWKKEYKVNIGIGCNTFFRKVSVATLLIGSYVSEIFLLPNFWWARPAQCIITSGKYLLQTCFSSSLSSIFYSTNTSVFFSL